MAGVATVAALGSCLCSEEDGDLATRGAWWFRQSSERQRTELAASAERNGSTAPPPLHLHHDLAGLAVSGGYRRRRLLSFSPPPASSFSFFFTHGNQPDPPEGEETADSFLCPHLPFGCLFLFINFTLLSLCLHFYTKALRLFGSLRSLTALKKHCCRIRLGNLTLFFIMA